MISSVDLGPRSPIGRRYIRPIVEILQDAPGHQMHKDELRKAIVRRYHLTDREAQHEMPSGRIEILSDMGNARSTLELAGLLWRPHETSRGIWELTDAGLEAELNDAGVVHLYRTHTPYSQKKRLSSPRP
jgi:hypothetical protein